jgi:hypothetical protein
VLLPAPAGPSMAMISLRGELSFILRVDDCTRWRDCGVQLARAGDSLFVSF